MIKMRPHHLLDILRDFGNDRIRDAHPWGASLNSVTQIVLSKPDHEIEFVLKVDSICETCSQLNENTCEAKINEQLLMRIYNDRLDIDLFRELKIKPNTKMTLIEFGVRVSENMNVLSLFTSPNENSFLRRKGTLSAFKRLGIEATKQPNKAFKLN